MAGPSKQRFTQHGSGVWHARAAFRPRANQSTTWIDDLSVMLMRGTVAVGDNYSGKPILSALSGQGELKFPHTDSKPALVQHLRTAYTAGAVIILRGIPGISHQSPIPRLASMGDLVNKVEQVLGQRDFLDAYAFHRNVDRSKAPTGIGAHWDPFTTLIAQTQGSRWWEIGQRVARRPLISGTVDDMQLSARILMQPGDLLCVPAGVVHRVTVAEGTEPPTQVTTGGPKYARWLDYILSKIKGLAASPTYGPLVAPHVDLDPAKPAGEQGSALFRTARNVDAALMAAGCHYEAVGSLLDADWPSPFADAYRWVLMPDSPFAIPTHPSGRGLLAASRGLVTHGSAR